MINEAHRQRYGKPNVSKAEGARLHNDFMIYGEQIKTLLTKMTAQPPRTASDLLDYAALMLWRRTSLSYDGGDPCEALNDAGAHATIQDHSAMSPPGRCSHWRQIAHRACTSCRMEAAGAMGPKELAQIIVAGLQSDRGLGQRVMNGGIRFNG